MARAALGLGVRELAKLADVSPDTIARLERGDELKANTVDIIQSALERAGVEFIDDTGLSLRSNLNLRKIPMSNNFSVPIESKKFSECTSGELVIVDYPDHRVLGIFDRTDNNNCTLLCLKSSDGPEIHIRDLLKPETDCISLGKNWLIEPTFNLESEIADNNPNITMGSIYVFSGGIGLGAVYHGSHMKKARAYIWDLQNLKILNNNTRSQLAASSWKLWTSPEERNAQGATPTLQFGPLHIDTDNNPS